MTRLTMATLGEPPWWPSHLRSFTFHDDRPEDHCAVSVQWKDARDTSGDVCKNIPVARVKFTVGRETPDVHEDVYLCCNAHLAEGQRIRIATHATIEQLPWPQQYRDWRGQIVEVGDVVLYPVRQGSSQDVVEARVLEFLPPGQFDWHKDGRIRVQPLRRTGYSTPTHPVKVTNLTALGNVTLLEKAKEEQDHG